MMSLEWSFSPNTQFVIGQHFTDHAFLPRTNHSRRAYSGRFSQPGHLAPDDSLGVSNDEHAICDVGQRFTDHVFFKRKNHTCIFRILRKWKVSSFETRKEG